MNNPHRLSIHVRMVIPGWSKLTSVLSSTYLLLVSGLTNNLSVRPHVFTVPQYHALSISNFAIGVAAAIAITFLAWLYYVPVDTLDIVHPERLEELRQRMSMNL